MIRGPPTSWSWLFKIEFVRLDSGPRLALIRSKHSSAEFTISDGSSLSRPVLMPGPGCPSGARSLKGWGVSTLHTRVGMGNDG